MSFRLLHYHRRSCMFVSVTCRLRYLIKKNMMTSSNGKIFRVTSHLCGEFTGHRCIPAQRPLMFSLIDTRIINGWVNNGLAGDLRRHHAHYGVTVMTRKSAICVHDNNLMANINEMYSTCIFAFVIFLKNVSTVDVGNNLRKTRTQMRAKMFTKRNLPEYVFNLKNKTAVY